MMTQTKLTTKWPQLIKAKRLELGESQEQFGRRFGVSGVAVGYWESNKNDPPGIVTWWLLGPNTFECKLGEGRR